MRTVRCSGRLGGVSASGGMVSGQGVSPWGVSSWGIYPEGGGSPLWTEFLTHACEIITFPQLLLRTVMIEQTLWYFRRESR